MGAGQGVCVGVCTCVSNIALSTIDSIQGRHVPIILEVGTKQVRMEEEWFRGGLCIC